MKATYKVVHFFTDLQDGNYAYKVGDTYPREGLEPSKDRIRELSSPFNGQMRVLIEEVKSERTREANDDD